MQYNYQKWIIPEQSVLVKYKKRICKTMYIEFSAILILSLTFSIPTVYGLLNPSTGCAKWIGAAIICITTNGIQAYNIWRIKKNDLYIRDCEIVKRTNTRGGNLYVLEWMEDGKSVGGEYGINGAYVKSKQGDHILIGKMKGKKKFWLLGNYTTNEFL